jgi:aminoglycoside phosphotransferase
MELPIKIKEWTKDYIWEENKIGHSESKVFFLKGPSTNCYLKVQPVPSIEKLNDEKRKLEWLQGKLPVPEVIYYESNEKYEFLLLSEIKGINASDPSNRANVPEVMRLIGEGLKQMHQLPIDQCPFQQQLGFKIEEARNRVNNGLVDVDNFDEIRHGRDSKNLFNELVDNRPTSEDLVFTHGDYCLPNIILDGGIVSGFIDIGRAGVADRYQDLALAIRSITYNFGREFIPHFLSGYGLSKLDNEKVEYYQLMDEFF